MKIQTYSALDMGQQSYSDLLSKVSDAERCTAALHRPFPFVFPASAVCLSFCVLAELQPVIQIQKGFGDIYLLDICQGIVSFSIQQ